MDESEQSNKKVRDSVMGRELCICSAAASPIISLSINRDPTWSLLLMCDGPGKEHSGYKWRPAAQQQDGMKGRTGTSTTLYIPVTVVGTRTPVWGASTRRTPWGSFTSSQYVILTGGHSTAVLL